MSDKPIRVLNLFTIMNRGGAETMVMNYYRNIDRSKVQFDFLVHRNEIGEYESEIKELGGRIYRMPPIYPQNFAKYKKKIRIFLKEHPEYKIIHSHMSELGYFVFKEAKRQGVPVRICHAHNNPHAWNAKMIMRTYFKYMMRPYITHMFMCGLESGIWLFGKKNKDKFIQLNNAIDAKQYIYNEKIEREVKKELGLKDEFVIGHVGRFSRQKNHEKLIDIFNEIIKIKSNSKLILVGEGPLKQSIIDKVKSLNLQDKVMFLGTRSDVNRIMQTFDVFIFPSLHEGLGIVLIEAQAAGVPCLTSKNVVAKEADISYLLNYYSLNNSSLQWAEKALSIVCEKENMYEIIKNSGFDISENANKLEEFYINEYNKYR